MSNTVPSSSTTTTTFAYRDLPRLPKSTHVLFFFFYTPPHCSGRAYRRVRLLLTVEYVFLRVGWPSPRDLKIINCAWRSKKMMGVLATKSPSYPPHTKSQRATPNTFYCPCCVQATFGAPTGGVLLYMVDMQSAAKENRKWPLPNGLTETKQPGCFVPWRDGHNHESADAMSYRVE